MEYRLIAFCFAFLFVHNISKSQTDSLAKQDRHFVTVAYFGDQLTHPGAMVGYGYRAVISKNKKHSFIIGSYLGGYRFPYNTRGVFITPYAGYQLRKKKGFQYDFQVGLGYLHTFADGEVLEYNNGAFTKIKDKGISRSMLPYISTGIGWHFSHIKKFKSGNDTFC